MDKKTIFLLPLDLKGKRQTRITPKFIREVFNSDKIENLPPHIVRKKNNIFTLELNRLIGKISEKNRTPNKQDEIKQDSLNEPEQKNGPIDLKKETAQFPVEFELLNKVYSNNSPEENAKIYLDQLYTSFGIESYCLFYFEPHTFTYYPVFCEGLSEKAHLNFLFQSHDNFLQNKTSGYIQLFFQPVLVNDTFFKKKLSALEFMKYSSLVLKFFDTHKLPGLMALFYGENKNPSSEELEHLSKEIDIKLEPMIPYLNQYFQTCIKAKMDEFDILRKIVQAIQIQSKNFENSFYLTKLKIQNYLNVEDRVVKKKNLLLLLKNYLLKQEGLIDICSNEMLLLTKENEVEKIINYISENSQTDFQFNLSSLKYPDNGKNLYLYF